MNKKILLDLFKKKKFNKVIKIGKKLLNENPNDLDLLNFLSFSYLQNNNFKDSKKYFEKILIFKKTPELYYNYGNILKNLNEYSDAIISFKRAIELKKNYSEAYNNLANCQKNINDYKNAILNYSESIKYNSNNYVPYVNLAKLYIEKKNYTEAINYFKKALKINANIEGIFHELGTIYSILGDFDQANDYFIKSLEINSRSWTSYKNYFAINKITKKDDVFLKLKKEIKKENLDNEQKINMYYSLSKGYQDQNDKEKCFQYLELANNLKKNQSNFLIKNQRKLFKNIKNFFDVNYNINLEHKNNIKIKPIFIVGMPRSGTTLIEQILSSHSKIFGAGELSYLPEIIDNIDLENIDDFKNIIINIRSKYFEKIEKLSDKNFIIDKLPMNFRWIGFIVKAFPEAKIIHLERNPMAICWSNYKTNFNNFGMDFALSQIDTAEYFVLYKNLMDYWFQKYKDVIININYESFVFDYKKFTKEILKIFNLKWEEKISDFYNNKRPVETASLYQVRKKVFTNSSKEWKNYYNFLKPIMEILNKNNIKY